jgi:hypothetical protein
MLDDCEKLGSIGVVIEKNESKFGQIESVIEC